MIGRSLRQNHTVGQASHATHPDDYVTEIERQR